jgi:gamma-glutamyltranspeptidase/glutathione hydrolase
MNFKLSSLVYILLLGVGFNSYSGIATAANISYRIHTEVKPDITKNELAKAKHDMVVTSNIEASQIAFNILHQGGGNAVDAAIAAAFVLSVVEPQKSGLGGGGYAIYYVKKSEEILTFDGRAAVPQSRYNLKLLSKFKSKNNQAKVVAIPGELALLYQLHQKNGKLPWNELVQPAIKLAEEGFTINDRLYDALVLEKNTIDKIPQVQSMFFTSNNKIKKVGSIVKNPEYADTLKLIAAHPNVFYRGKIGKNIMSAVNNIADGQILNASDFKDYIILNKKPICSFYREKYQICSLAPSSVGGITLEELLLIYSQVYYPTNEHDVNWIYYFIEASKLAYADRNNYIKNYAQNYDLDSQNIDYDYLKSSYIDARSKLITKNQLNVSENINKQEAKAFLRQHVQPVNNNQMGATSIAIVDEEGNAINLTLNLENLFGSKIWVDGFFLNDVLKNLSLPAHKLDKNNNLIEEEQLRPASMMTPNIVLDEFGNVKLITSSTGGNPLTCYVAKNIILMLDFNLDPYSASKFGNLCSINNRPLLEANSNIEQYVSLLNNKNESALPADLTSAEVSIIKGNNGYWYGASDPREIGLAIGE